MKKTFTIYITNQCKPKQKERIVKFFGIDGMTVSGECKVTIEDEGTLAMLKETAARGFIQIRNKQ